MHTAKKTSFFPSLNDAILQKTKSGNQQADQIDHAQEQTRRSFVSLGHRVPLDFLHAGEYYSFQWDVMNVVYTPLKSSPRCTTVELCMLDMWQNRLRPYLTGRRSATLRQIHFHLDVQSVIVLEKFNVQTSRNSARLQSSTAIRDSGQSRRHELGDAMKFPWSGVTTNDSEKEAFSSALLFNAARAALILNAEYNAVLTSEDSARSRRIVKVFLHDGS